MTIVEKILNFTISVSLFKALHNLRRFIVLREKLKNKTKNDRRQELHDGQEWIA